MRWWKEDVGLLFETRKERAELRRAPPDHRFFAAQRLAEKYLKLADGYLKYPDAWKKLEEMMLNPHSDIRSGCWEALAEKAAVQDFSRVSSAIRYTVKRIEEGDRSGMPWGWYVSHPWNVGRVAAYFYLGQMDIGAVERMLRSRNLHTHKEALIAVAKIIVHPYGRWSGFWDIASLVPALETHVNDYRSDCAFFAQAALALQAINTNNVQEFYRWEKNRNLVMNELCLLRLVRIGRLKRETDLLPYIHAMAGFLLRISPYWLRKSADFRDFMEQAAMPVQLEELQRELELQFVEMQKRWRQTAPCEMEERIERKALVAWVVQGITKRKAKLAREQDGILLAGETVRPKEREKGIYRIMQRGIHHG